MKSSDRMRIEAGKEEVIKYSYRCDLCGKESIYHMTCYICGRDICSGCTKFDPRCMGDYPDRYCVSCFNIGHKYLKQISIEQEKFDALVERFEKEWKDDAIKSIRGTSIKVDEHKLKKCYE